MTPVRERDPDERSARSSAAQDAISTCGSERSSLAIFLAAPLVIELASGRLDLARLDQRLLLHAGAQRRSSGRSPRMGVCLIAIKGRDWPARGPACSTLAGHVRRRWWRWCPTAVTDGRSRRCPSPARCVPRTTSCPVVENNVEALLVVGAVGLRVRRADRAAAREHGSTCWPSRCPPPCFVAFALVFAAERATSSTTRHYGTGGPDVRADRAPSTVVNAVHGRGLRRQRAARRCRSSTGQRP